MIQFENSLSPNFEYNKDAVQSIIKNLESLGFTFSGWCNSYGYEVEAESVRNGMNYHVIFRKHQTTQNGVVIPMDAKENCETHMTVSGINPAWRVSIGKSMFIRYFTQITFRELLEKPFYILQTTGVEFPRLKKITNLMRENNMSTFKIKNGHLSSSNPTGIVNPTLFFTELDSIIARY